MPKWDTVAILGVGLIGGSLGLALKERGLARRVVGIGRRADSLDVARSLGLIDHGTTDLADGVREAQLIVVCTPVDVIADQVVAAATLCPPGAMITDAGSTKASILAAVAEQLKNNALHARFVGSHPLAGSEKSGPEAARADLFLRRTVVVTPTTNTPPADLAETQSLWAAVGAKVVTMSPDEHDRAVAAISHLPHLVAASLAEATDAADIALAAGGWRDTTRVAAGDAELWRQIMLDNRQHVLKSLAQFEKTLARWRAALEQGDADAVYRLLQEAKTKRDALGS